MFSPSPRCAAFFMLLALVGCGRQPPAAPPPKTPEVIVGLPVTKEVTDYEDCTGWAEAVASVEVRARVSGYLQKVLFKEGADVQEGQPLFQIDPSIYTAELKRAEGTLQQAKAHLDRLQRDFQRVEPLLPSQAISREDYDKIVGDRAEAEAAVIIAEGARDLAKLNLGFTQVLTPISGRVSRQLIDPGNMVKADETPLTTIVSLDPIYAYFDVDERTTLRVRRLIREGKVPSAREATVSVLAGLVDEVDDQGVPQYRHSGTINFVDNRVDAMAGTLRLRGVFENPKRLLAPGMFLRVRIPIGKPHPAVLISEQALGTDQGQSFVYVVNDENKTVYRRVRLGAFQDGLRVVEEGLAAGERIVVKGLQRVRPGALVEPKPAEMPARGPSEKPPLVTDPAAASGSRPSS